MRYRTVLTGAGLACLVAISSLAFAGPSLAAAPPNDDFANATPLASAAVSAAGQSNIGATGESGEPYDPAALRDDCTDATTPDPGCLQSVWYSWTAPSDGIWTVDTCFASTFGGDLSVYEGTTWTELANNLVGSDHTRCGGAGGGAVSFNAASGATYMIQVAGTGANGAAQTGNFTLSISSAPQTVIDGWAPVVNPADPATPFEFSSTVPAATFECQVNAGGYFPCTSPFGWPGTFTDGHLYVVRVRATYDGHPDPTPAVQAFRIDTTAPDTTLGTPVLADGGSVTFPVHQTDVNPAYFECNLDDAGFAYCGDADSMTGDASVSFPGFCTGAHSLEVRSIDAAGNVDPTPATAASDACGSRGSDGTGNTGGSAGTGDTGGSGAAGSSSGSGGGSGSGGDGNAVGGGSGGDGGAGGSAGGGGSAATGGHPITQPTGDPLAHLAAGQLSALKTQQSPDLRATGTTVVTTDGSSLDVQELYSGKLAKTTVIGRVTKKNLKAAAVPWTIKLSKVAAKTFKRRKTLNVTIRSRVTPPKGKGKVVVTTMKVTLKRGKEPARCAAHAHAAC